MGKESQLLEASAAGNYNKVENLLQNISKLKRILSSEKSLDCCSDEEEEPSLRIMAVKKAPHLNIDTVDENGSSPLILAALNGHRSVVHLLLSYSANVAIVDHQGNTALHFAAWHNRSDIVELLLSNDAVADTANKEGNTPLHYACQYCPVGKTLTIVKLLQWSDTCILKPNKAGDTPFSLAIRFNKKEAVSLLVDAEPKILKETKSLLDASQNGRTEIVEALLDAGMDPNCIDGASGNCPLHEAVRFFRIDTARILLEFGASCDQTSANGEVALEIAKHHPEAKREEFIKIFIEYRNKPPRIAKALLEKMQVSKQTKKKADIYITYPLLKNKSHWTKADHKFCSAWTKQHPNTFLLDNDETSYWKIPAAGAYSWVAFDLGSKYTLTGIRLAGWGDKQMVHAFIVEVAASLSGPWRQVQKFKADSIGPEDMAEPAESQDFRGFRETSQYWKLVIADNFGAPNTCLAEVQFFGVEDGVLEWFENLNMTSMLKGFVQRGFNQLSELALLTMFDISDLVSSEQESKRLLDAVALLREKCFPPRNLQWAIEPSSKATTDKPLSEFRVYSDPHTIGELRIVARGGAVLGGKTVRPLVSRQNAVPTCAFTGLTISPPGQYSLEVHSISDPSVMLRSDPIVVAPPPMRTSQLGQVFDDLDKMLQF